MNRLIIGILYWLVSVALTCTLFSSRSNDAYSLRHHLLQSPSDYPLSFYWRGVELNIEQALNQLRSKALSEQKTYWLDKLVSLDNGETAWQRYLAAKTPRQQAKWLKKAATQGVAQAQFLYSMTINSAINKERWLKRAAEQNYLDAQIALTGIYCKVTPLLRFHG
jgi:hypothetical protein